MATIIDSYTSGMDGTNSMNGLNYRCQTFTASQTYTINSVILKLYRAGDEVQTLTIRIYGVDASSPVKPNIADLKATGTMDGDTVTLDTDGLEYTINLDTPVELTSGVQYAIVGDCRSSTPGVHYLHWKKDGRLIKDFQKN